MKKQFYYFELEYELKVFTVPVKIMFLELEAVIIMYFQEDF